MSKTGADPIIFCFCGPSASGKSTICQNLEGRVANLRRSISTTTRAPREGEEDGVHYHFVDREEFERRVSDKKFLEHAQYGKNLYGTEQLNIRLAKEKGEDLLLDIEVQGVTQLKKSCGEQLVTVFVFPPSFEVLKERLEQRGTETEAQLKERLEIAQGEIDLLKSEGFSDYLLVNDAREEAIEKACSIISAERQQFSRVGPDISFILG